MPFGDVKTCRRFACLLSYPPNDWGSRSEWIVRINSIRFALYVFQALTANHFRWHVYRKTHFKFIERDEQSMNMESSNENDRDNLKSTERVDGN